MREEDTVCVGSDGLQYCKVCGEAKEAFFPEGGFMGMKKHSRQCACDRKAYEEEQKYFKDKEHRELASRIPANMADVTGAIFMACIKKEN